MKARKNDVAQLYTATGEIDYLALSDIEIISKALVKLEVTFNDLEANLTLPWQHCNECSESYYKFVSGFREEEL